MQVMYKRCAGLDVHKKSVVACRMARRGNRPGKEIRTFGTTTQELLSLHDWLQEWEVTHVALESTGEYWRPVYNVLEGDYELLLVNARHVKQVPGRKTDVKDAEWLADLLKHGLLRASYVPDKSQRQLRDLTRYRTKLVQQRAQVVNRLQKVLEDANIKLSSVVTDVLGVSGRAMLEALIAGETDGERLAQLARGRLKSKEAALEEALTGYLNDHHRFLLRQQLALFDFLSRQVEELNQQIAAQIETMDGDQSEPPPPPEAREQNELGQEDEKPEEALTYAEAIILLDTIPGVDVRTAQVLVAEMGVDMARFPTAKHLAAWGGVAPGQNESAGKRRAAKSRHGNRSLRSALSQAAWAASHTKETYLRAQFQHLAARRGKKRAIVAVGHSILVIAYHLLHKREPYCELGHDFFDQRKRDATVRHLLHRLDKLGIEVTQVPAPVAS
jgi:transposase